MFWKQLPEPNPSPGKSSTIVQCRDTKRPHFKDACGSWHLNMSPSKHAWDSLAPVNFAIRLRGEFSPALVTPMGCSHGPCDRGDTSREGSGCGSPRRNFAVAELLLAQLCQRSCSCSRKNEEPENHPALGVIFFFWLGHILAWRNCLSTQQPRWHESGKMSMMRGTEGAKIAQVGFVI